MNTTLHLIEKITKQKSGVKMPESKLTVGSGLTGDMKERWGRRHSAFKSKAIKLIALYIAATGVMLNQQLDVHPCGLPSTEDAIERKPRLVMKQVLKGRNERVEGASGVCIRDDARLDGSHPAGHATEPILEYDNDGLPSGKVYPDDLFDQG